MPVESHSLGPFSVRVWKEGSGRPLVYLHGFEQHPGGAPFLHRLAAGRTVYAPEHPGYGKSEGFSVLEDFLDLTLFYRELIGTWGVDEVDVVGHCFGGMIAAELAALCPQLVKRLVLINAYGLWLDGVDAPDPFSLTPDELRRAKWHDPDAAPSPEPTIAVPDPADPIAASIERNQNLAVAAKFLWPLPDRGLRKRLHLIKAPTLVLHGVSDGLVPVAHAHEFGKRVPHAEVELIERAGHLPMIEQQDAVCDRVLAFVDGA